MKATLLRGKTALVTGASSGIGVDIARELAARGMQMILVARREEQLRQVANELHNRFGVSTRVIALDLAERDAPQRLYDQLQAEGVAVDVLVNNAGFGLYGEFLQIDWERERNMFELNIIALVHMTKLFVHDMVVRNFGYVMQLASVAAYQPTPMYTSYAAGKAFVLHFAEALACELRRTNVSVTAVSPGVTATAFFEIAGQAHQMTPYQRVTTMPSQRVASIAVEAMLERKPSLVIGRFNWFMSWISRFFPRKIVTLVTERLVR